MPKADRKSHMGLLSGSLHLWYTRRQVRPSAGTHYWDVWNGGHCKSHLRYPSPGDLRGPFQNVLFGCVTEWTHFYSIPFYVVLWILNGFIQAAGWPTVVCVMGNWFGRGGRGLVLGFWSSCQSIGNIVGTYMSMAVLDYGYQVRPGTIWNEDGC